MLYISGEEVQLASHICELARRGFPLTCKQVKSLAYEFARRNNISGFLSTPKRMAGVKWFKAFMNRHPELKKTNAKNLSQHRATAAHPAAVNLFFAAFGRWKTEFKLTEGNQIWNVDESGVQDVPNDGDTVVSAKGESAFRIVSSEQGERATILTYVSANGLVCPPMVIFKGEKVQTYWRVNAPGGVHVRASTSGYINRNLFAEYGRIFVQFLNTMNLLDRNHLVLLDNHKSHLYNINYLQKMSVNNIQIGSLPAHCTHYMQPLDDAPFAQLKKTWNHNLIQQMREMLGMKMTKPEWLQLIARTFRQSMTPNTVIAGFRHTGIWPTDPRVPKLMILKTYLISKRKQGY